jgi:flavin reductase (DIM6/NTAB) family NADH-FMN oxidoreductase RutF
MISHFGRGFAQDQSPFDGISIVRSPAGIAVLEEALAFLECQVKDRFPAGDHDLVIAEAVSGKLLSEGHPMEHIRKRGAHY